jgi:hypothetical protein
MSNKFATHTHDTETAGLETRTLGLVQITSTDTTGLETRTFGANLAI